MMSILFLFVGIQAGLTSSPVRIVTLDYPPYQYKELNPSIQSFPAYIGYSKANNPEELRDAIDASLREMRADGSYQRIIDSYITDWELQ